MIINFTGAIHLDSSLEDDRTENNTPAHFTNYLHTGFQFSHDNEYEVALHEIQIPNTWQNLSVNQGCAVVSENQMVGGFKYIPKGSYNSIPELLGHVNNLFLDGTLNPPKLVYDEKIGRVCSIVGEYKGRKTAHIYVTKILAWMLGFTDRYILTGLEAGDAEKVDVLVIPSNYSDEMASNSITPILRVVQLCNPCTKEIANMPPSINYLVPRLFVECSIVKHVVHHTRHLLRAIPVAKDNSFGNILSSVFDRPLFAPLSTNYFDRISIKITDSNGNEIGFIGGSVILTLEIRKKKNDYEF